MGNRLSGNFGRRWSKKAFIHELPCLDIRHFLDGSRLRTGGYSMPIQTLGRLYLNVRFNQIIVSGPTTVWKLAAQGITIVTTGNRPSLRRTWLCCPNLRCDRRVIALYFRNGFFCRHCLGLSYASQHLSKVQRLYGEYARLEQRLDLFEGEPIRPKGMHRATYEPMADRARQLHRFLFEPVERSFQRIREADLAATARTLQQP